MKIMLYIISQTYVSNGQTPHSSPVLGNPEFSRAYPSIKGQPYEVRLISLQSYK